MESQASQNHILTAFEAICAIKSVPTKRTSDQLEYELLKIIFDKIPDCNICAQFVLQFGQHIKKSHPTTGTQGIVLPNDEKSTNLNKASPPGKNSKPQNIGKDNLDKSGDSHLIPIAKDRVDLPSSKLQVVDLQSKEINDVHEPFQPRFSSSFIEISSDEEDGTLVHPENVVAKNTFYSQRETRTLKLTPRKAQPKRNQENLDSLSTPATILNNVSNLETPYDQRNLLIPYPQQIENVEMTASKEIVLYQDKRDDLTDPSFTDDDSNSSNSQDSALLPCIASASEEASPNSIKELKWYSESREGSILDTPGNYFTCSICKKGFPSESDLEIHLRTCGKKNIKCHVCDKTFATPFTLKRHMKTHLSTKNSTCQLRIGKEHNFQKLGAKAKLQCNFCDKFFNDKNKLKRHMRYHSGDNPFKCEICKGSYPNKLSLSIHVKSHTGEKPIECEICKKSFISKSNLTVHIMEVHTTKRKPYECNICGKTFQNLNKFKDHTKSHSFEIIV